MRRHRWRASIVWSAVIVGQISLIAGIGAGTQRTAAHAIAGTMHMSMDQMAAAAPLQGTTVALHQRVVRVSIHNFAFKPARLVVSPGTRIIWTNTDSDPHTVDSTKNVWSSEALDTSGTFARVFAKTGTFPYYCSVHPFMHGLVTVKR